MADFHRDDLTGARFERVDLTDAHFERTLFVNTRINQSYLSGVVLHGVELVDVSIDGEVENLVINGVDVTSYVDAELDRRDPGRVTMRATTPHEFREAWDLVELRWGETVERARGLDPTLLHESVDGEWSFIETLRHLSFATDAWIRRGILGDPEPWHPLDLPWDQLPDRLIGKVPQDRSVRPSLDEVLAVRLDRMATVRAYVDALTDETLASSTEPVPGESWPPSESLSVKECLRIVLNEEWQHRLFAERDLDKLTAVSD